MRCAFGLPHPTAEAAAAASRLTPLPQEARCAHEAIVGGMPSMALKATRFSQRASINTFQSMYSTPPMYGRSASGTSIEPSAFW